MSPMLRALSERLKPTFRTGRDNLVRDFFVTADKHRRMGVPMALWQNGRAVLATPAPTGRPRQARRKP